MKERKTDHVIPFNIAAFFFFFFENPFNIAAET